ncbi:hypothetical protein RDI58_026838 [Solanum bulbocastanum]|uniref:Disease resistance R13L4/SHOC-2-like LRR domain-containing protein n=1 Tax=Solanum bulbocastanum TaxID=147425 RepID=A0AAN8SX41_SOLBU
MSIFNLSSLDTLQLIFNKLEGDLPSDVGFNLPSLKFFLLVGNQLIGKVPTSILNSTSIMEFGIDANNFTGQVPAFGNQKDLYWLGLAGNHFGNGMLDDLKFMYSLQNCTSLEQLILENNNLGGVLPRYIGNMSNLLRLSVGRNLIQGNIPTEILQLENLQVLGLEKNNFTGMIPESFGQLRRLGKLHFHHNKFSGEIPHSLGNLTRLIELDLGSNKLQGIGSGNLTGLINLIYMNHSYNNLSGEIPSSVGTLTSLRELYLGRIRKFLDELVSLKFLNLSYNDLEGEVPLKGAYFRNMSAVSLVGNSELCGGIPEFEMPKCSDKVASRRRRGILEENGKFVAIKVLKLQVRGASKSFLTECEALRHIKHRNLVKLLTSCSSIDNQGNEFKALIF